MNGWLIVAAIIGATAVALLAPWPFVAVLALGAMAVMQHRAGFLAFAASTLLINGLLMAWLDPAPMWQWTFLSFGWDGFLAGLIGGSRLVALLGANRVLFQQQPPALWLEDLRLPRRARGFVAALLIAAQDIGRDFSRLQEAKRVEGEWPERRSRQWRMAAQLLPTLMVAAYDRAHRRRDALRLAGMDTGPRFAPIVAVAALAIAGRMALVGLPNVALTYVIVFAGGVAFGARVGAWAGFWSMLLTDLILSGLYLPSLVNVPTMALLGATGGLFRAWGADRVADRALAGALGVLLTLAWSMATDALRWWLIPEFQGSVELLKIHVAGGLAFNVVPALINGLLFAATLGPIGRAFSALQSGPATLPTSPMATADLP